MKYNYLESDSTNDHHPTTTKGEMDHRCAICGNKPYEHAWYSYNEDEEEEDEREPLVDYRDTKPTTIGSVLKCFRDVDLVHHLHWDVLSKQVKSLPLHVEMCGLKLSYSDPAEVWGNILIVRQGEEAHEFKFATLEKGRKKIVELIP